MKCRRENDLMSVRDQENECQRVGHYCGMLAENINLNTAKRVILSMRDRRIEYVNM